MPAGAGNPPNIKMEPPKSNFNIREGGAFNIRGKGLLIVCVCVPMSLSLSLALSVSVRVNAWGSALRPWASLYKVR